MDDYRRLFREPAEQQQASLKEADGWLVPGEKTLREPPEWPAVRQRIKEEQLPELRREAAAMRRWWRWRRPVWWGRLWLAEWLLRRYRPAPWLDPRAVRVRLQIVALWLWLHRQVIIDWTLRLIAVVLLMYLSYLLVVNWARIAAAIAQIERSLADTLGSIFRLP